MTIYTTFGCTNKHENETKKRIYLRFNVKKIEYFFYKLNQPQLQSRIYVSKY